MLFYFSECFLFEMVELMLFEQNRISTNCEASSAYLANSTRIDATDCSVEERSQGAHLVPLGATDFSGISDIFSASNARNPSTGAEANPKSSLLKHQGYLANSSPKPSPDWTRFQYLLCVSTYVTSKWFQMVITCFSFNTSGKSMTSS